jgi:hypothetical protein
MNTLAIPIFSDTESGDACEDVVPIIKIRRTAEMEENAIYRGMILMCFKLIS